MRTTLTYGQVSGIPLRVHLNWFLTVILVTWSLAVGYFPLEYPGWGTTTDWLVSVATALLFFFSVLLHEMGHAQIAIREGVPVRSITLFILGGVAHIENEPETAGAEFRIVIAGPFVSVILAAVFYVLSMVPDLGVPGMAIALYLSRINLILAIFNLIPGFPLDGGRILRAFLWRILNDFRRATRWATTTGFAIGLLLVGLGLFFIFLGNIIGGLWMAFVGGYLGIVARSAQQATDELYEDDQHAWQEALTQVPFDFCVTSSRLQFSEPPPVTTFSTTGTLAPVILERRWVRAIPFTEEGVRGYIDSLGCRYR